MVFYQPYKWKGKQATGPANRKCKNNYQSIPSKFILDELPPKMIDLICKQNLQRQTNQNEVINPTWDCISNVEM